MEYWIGIIGVVIGYLLSLLGFCVKDRKEETASFLPPRSSRGKVYIPTLEKELQISERLTKDDEEGSGVYRIK